MMSQQPSQSDINKAKEYIKQRLGAELSMLAVLESLMKEAAKQIVIIVYADRPRVQNFAFSGLSAKAQFKIEEVIDWLRELIESNFEARCIPEDDEQRKFIIPWVKRGKNGITHTDKLNEYLGNFSKELEVLIGAGLFLKLTSSTLIQSIGLNLKHPYANTDLADGIGREITYGRGKTNSMLTAIGNLTRYGIARGWSRSKLESEHKQGATGWLVMRGSSYPCDICDGNCGFYQSMDLVNLPVHPNCCCYAVPIYN